MASALHTKWKTLKKDMDAATTKQMKLDFGPSLDDFDKFSKEVLKLIDQDANSVSKKTSDLMEKVIKAKGKIDLAVKEYKGIFAKLKVGGPLYTQELHKIDIEIKTQYDKLAKAYAKHRQNITA